MSLFAMFKSAGPTGFGYGSTAEQVTEGLSLAGQTILVTGCNSGIGQEACRVLALRGALVLGTARTKEKAAVACATLPGKAVGYSLRALRSFFGARVRRSGQGRWSPARRHHLQRGHHDAAEAREVARL
jgi:NAD(P)-dependent dehydrogenase (short-subunit alcohol dehydrogenase family)